VVKGGSDGAINVYNNSETPSVTVGIQGSFTDNPDGDGGFVALNPVRFANTAGGAAGANVPQTRLAVGAHLDIQAAGVSTFQSRSCLTGGFDFLCRRGTALRMRLYPGGSHAILARS
jgi:hypothetical protein